MSLPFTRDQFVEVFRSYHQAIGWMPMLLLALAAAVLTLAFSTNAWRHRMIAGVLALLWLWSGVVYHWAFFATINPAARFFGALFVAQAVLLVVFGVIRGQWHFDPQRATATRLGWVLILYALAVYPLISLLSGHRYPSGPSFGAPCPTTIFYLGTTLWMAGRTPIAAAIIPLIWALIGTSAAFSLGMSEDLGLTLSGFIVLITIMRQRPSRRRLTPEMSAVPPPVGA